MKWQTMTKEQSGEVEIIYLDTEPAINLIVEISCKKKGYEVSCHKHDNLVGKYITFKTLPAAKRHGEKWVKIQLGILTKDIKKVLEG
jgi:hypothetical protein